MSAKRRRGFTLVELIVVVAIVGVILTLAAPSFYDYILRQRLKSVHAQLLTDLAYARSQAAATGSFSRISFSDEDDGAGGITRSCYTIYTVRPVANHRKIRCDCLADTPCPADALEVRTVRLPGSQRISVAVTSQIDWSVGFDPADGSLYEIPTDLAWAPLNRFDVETRLDTRRTLRTTIVRSGRTTTCATGDNLGAPRC